MKRKIINLFLLLFLTQCFYIDGQPMGTGRDGSPSISGIVNSYTRLLSVGNQCSAQLIVENASIVTAGDLILIIQMQGAEIDNSNTSSYGSIVNYRNAGNFEYAKVRGVIGSNIIELEYPPILTYDTAGKVQVIRVPQYVNPTVNGKLTCLPWNGSTGGLLAIDATGTITLDSAIDVSGLGFRGAQIIIGPDNITDTSYFSETPSLLGNGPKGEGIAFNGVDPFTSGKGAPANGGGGGNTHTGGAGGGSNIGFGGLGGWGYPVTTDYTKAQGIGGWPLTYVTGQAKVFMGGGGGAGSSHAGEGTNGGNGGAIVILTADIIGGNINSINSRGDSSLSGGSPTHADGIGGGGAGGSVLLSVNSINGNLSVDARGGNGGNPSLMGAGPGGGGGGGVCRTNSAALFASISFNGTGGIAGLINASNYGSANGNAGSITDGLLILMNYSNPVVHAGFTVVPVNDAGTNIVLSNKSTNATFYHWNFGDNSTDTASDPQHNYKSPGIYLVTLVASDAGSCNDTATEIVITNAVNVFTPNGDFKNDYFSFPNLIPENYSMKFTIYDRWGLDVFDGNTTNPKWDGTVNGHEANEGTYYYILEILDLKSNIPIIKKGTVTLLRGK